MRYSWIPALLLAVFSPGCGRQAQTTRSADERAAEPHTYRVARLRGPMAVQPPSAASVEPSAPPVEEHDEDFSVHDEEALVAG